MVASVMWHEVNHQAARHNDGACASFVRFCGVALQSKLKILVRFVQLVCQVSTIYEIILPPTVLRMLEPFSFILGEWLSGDCLGLHNYYRRLMTWMLAPWIVTATFGTLLLAWECVRSSHAQAGHAARDQSQRTYHAQTTQGDARAQRALQTLAAFVTALLLLIYPIVTQLAFSVFACFELGNDGSRFLLAKLGPR